LLHLLQIRLGVGLCEACQQPFWPNSERLKRIKCWK
jgi:hypothetical protein